MASIQQDPSGNFHVCFRFRDHRFKRSLKTNIRRKAEAAASRIEENLRLVDEGRIELPDGVDVPVFLLSDGKLAEKPRISRTITAGSLFHQYTEAIPDDSLESTSLATMKIHMKHITRILGESQMLRPLGKSDLQQYVTQRSREPGRKGTISAATIRKEIATFGSLWNWARSEGFVDAEFPRKGLMFPKATERPPFQTWEQITRQIRDNSLIKAEAAHLWDCLYFSCDKLKQLLQFIEKQSQHDSLYPMCVLAAYTGARRSELCRALVSDIDFVASTFTIQERKRSRSHRTTRTVPMCEAVVQATRVWLAEKPECRFLFPEDHRALKLRRSDDEKGSLKPFEATNFLRGVLSGSDWDSVKGWHVFRHSFISNCASRGTDQRFIDQWVGHQTDEQRRRYRHLFPESQQQAIDLVFQ
jgi:integrase